jgi:nitroreductase
MTDKSCDQVPLWGVIHSSADLPHDWVNAGRVLEKCYLSVTQLGYAICPVSYPVESVVGREALRKLIGLPENRIPQALVRVGYASKMERSVRRKLTSVLI